MRLVLREFVESDWPAVYAYASDPEVVRFMPFGPRAAAQCRQWTASLAAEQTEPRTGYTFAVVLAATERVIGSCDLGLHLGEGHRDAELGYLYARSAWGHGYATEAARAAMAFAFDALRVHRVYATCDVGNVASLRVLEKLGMRREGLLKSSFHSQQGWRDHYLHAVLEDEWRARQQRPL